MYLQGFCAF